MDTENEIEVNPVESIVDALADGNFNAATDMFNDAMSGRIADALDAKRMEVGTGMSFDSLEIENEDGELEEVEVEDLEDDIDFSED